MQGSYVVVQKKHVAVLMGGWSVERSVSLMTGQECSAALVRAGYQVSDVDVDRDIYTTLKTLSPDVCFNALHGPFGEDGVIQGVLELLEIPYTHSGVMASALAINKVKAKALFRDAGIPVAAHQVVHRLDAARAHVMPPPYVVKPIDEGSSYGVLIVADDAQHPPQQLAAEAWPYRDFVMVEKYLPGAELTCSVMGDVALGVTEIKPVGQAFYDFDAKYKPGGSRHELPAQLKPNIYQKVQEFALKAHAALGCRGVSRADFRYDDRLHGTGELICLEVNTQPGMTPTSLVPEAAEHAGHSFEQLVSWMVEDASCCR